MLSQVHKEISYVVLYSLEMYRNVPIIHTCWFYRHGKRLCSLRRSSSLDKENARNVPEIQDADRRSLVSHFRTGEVYSQLDVLPLKHFESFIE